MKVFWVRCEAELDQSPNIKYYVSRTAIATANKGNPLQIPTRRVFISHPVSGNVEENLAAVARICRKIHSKDVLPIFPSFTTRRYLTPDLTDRELAAAQIYTYLSSGLVNEIWFYGDVLTEGMERELRIALLFNVRIVGMSQRMQEVLSSKMAEPVLYSGMSQEAIGVACKRLIGALSWVERRRERADVLYRQLNAEISQLQAVCPHGETRRELVQDVAEMKDRDFCVFCGVQL